MASVQYFPHQSIASLEHLEDIRYRSSPSNGPLGYYTPQHFLTQDAVTYMLTLPTPLVSIPLPQPTRQTVTFFEAVQEIRSGVVKEETCVLKATDDRVWSIGCARWWTQSDVKWNGYVEYPESDERSSIAREVEHQNILRLNNEQRSKEKR
jgi:hypothetical protein